MEKFAQAVFQQARHVVVVVVVREAAAKRNRPDREQTSAVLVDAIDDVRADAAVRSRATIEYTRKQKLFESGFEGRAMTFRGSNYRNEVRGTQVRTDLVDLEPGSSASRKTEIAYSLIGCNTLKQKVQFTTIRFRSADLVRPLECAFGGETYAGDLLRCDSVATPQAAILAIELVVILAGLAGPDPHTTFCATHLDHMREL